MGTGAARLSRLARGAPLQAYRPAPWTGAYGSPGPPGECARNAYALAADHPELTLVSGWARPLTWADGLAELGPWIAHYFTPWLTWAKGHGW